MRYSNFLFILTFAYSLWAEDTAPIKQLLSTVLNTYSVTIQQEKLRALENSGYTIPIIQDAEFKVKNDAFEFGKQTYALRVDPSGFGEIRSERNMSRMLNEYTTSLSRYKINDALLDRYMLALNYIESRVKRQLNEKLVVLYEDRIKVMEQKVYNSEIDMSLLIEAENELTKLKTNNIEDDKEMRVMRHQIAEYLQNDSFAQFDTSGLIDIVQISREIDSTSVVFDTNNVYMKMYRLGFGVSEARYQLERASSRRYIPYMEFSYDHGQMTDELSRQDKGKSFNLNKAYTFEVGVKIPFVNSDRQNIARKKIDFLSDKESYETLNKDLRDQMYKDIEDIRASITEYNHLRQREQEVAVEASLKKYIQMSGVDPLIVLSIKESSIKNSLQMESLRFSTIRNFIRVMDVTGKLSEKPLRNYISVKQESFE